VCVHECVCVYVHAYVCVCLCVCMSVCVQFACQRCVLAYYLGTRSHVSECVCVPEACVSCMIVLPTCAVCVCGPVCALPARVCACYSLLLLNVHALTGLHNGNLAHTHAQARTHTLANTHTHTHTRTHTHTLTGQHWAGNLASPSSRFAAPKQQHANREGFNIAANNAFGKGRMLNHGRAMGHSVRPHPGYGHTPQVGAACAFECVCMWYVSECVHACVWASVNIGAGCV